MERGGFPEPLLAEEPRDADRWRLRYTDSLVRVDILDTQTVSDLRAVELVLQLLRRRIGSPVSYASIAEDVGVSPNTVKKYLEVLEALFIVFRVVPHSRDIARAQKKAPKFYFYDTGQVPDSGARYENFVAVSLYKHVLARVDQQGRRCSLRYLRTRDGREVDFCIVEEEVPVLLLEAKYADAHIAPALAAFCSRYGIEGVQIVRHLKRQRQQGKLSVRSARSFFESLD